jgi:hypothetical protein
MATFEGAVRVTAIGSNQATGAATARIAIPNTSAGTAPRYIRVAGINECYVRVGDVTVVATTNDLLIQPADAVILTVQGCTHIAFIQGAAVGRISVVPLEDQ